MIEKAASDGVNTAFDRAAQMKPCNLGSGGSLGKHCGMGAGRVPLDLNQCPYRAQFGPGPFVCIFALPSLA